MGILSTPADLVSNVTDPIAAKIKNPFSTSVKPHGERGQDFPGGLIITEYVEGQPKNDTILRLVGNLMPFQPFEWEGEQRLVKVYYPGNPEPNVQVLGPKEGNVTLKGRFKDKRYKDASYYGVAYQYTKACDEMRKRGNLIKVTMAGPAGKWERYCLIEKSRFKMNKLSWIDYEIEIFVIGEQQPINNYFAAQEKQAPGNVNQNLINAASAFAEAYKTSPGTMPQSLAGLINGLVNDVAKNINLVTNFVSNIINTAQDVASAANRAIGLIKNAKANLSKFKRQVGQITHSFSSLSSSGNSAQQFRDSFANIHLMNRAHRDVGSLQDFLAQMENQFQAIAKSLPLRRYKVNAGDNLQRISTKFYGVPDHWVDIYNHNKLQSTALTVGATLEIPKL